MRPAHHALVTAVSVSVALAIAGCGSPTAESPAGPTALGPAAASSPPGTYRVTCRVRGDQGDLTLALDLPDGFRPRGPCSWRRALDFEPEAPGQPSSVQVSTVEPDPDYPEGPVSAEEIYEDQEPFAVADDDFAGDDTIYRLRLERDVPVFGATVGDRVSWECFCDGAPYVVRIVQAAGVELQWSSVPDIVEQTDAELATALAGAGLAP